MARCITTGRWAAGLPSFCFFHVRRQVVAPVLWVVVLQWTYLCVSCPPSQPRSLGVFEGAAAVIVRREPSFKLPGTGSNGQLRLDEGNYGEEAVPLSQQQVAATTILTAALGHAEERRLSATLLKKGAPGAALVLALFSGVATQLYGSPKQAYKRFSLKARRKVPWSWSAYMRNLPVINESDFTDFPTRWPKMGNRHLVMLVRDVSPKLAKFLHLGREEKLHGIAIKATAVGKGRTARDVLGEVNAHMNMVPRSKFILPVLGAYRAKSAKRVYLILPRMRANARFMLERQADTVNVQLALAEMAYSVKLLHDAGFLHRDIKLLNFFVGFDGHMVLADFEGAFDKTMWVDCDRDLMVYSEGYLAPEISTNKQWVRFNEKTDVYALGICFKYFLERATRVPRKADLKHLVEKMTAKDVSERYTMKQVLTSPFFEGINFDEIELLNQGVPFPEGDQQYEDTRRFL